MTYTIESGVPVPARINTNASKYPWGLMDVNDSFMVPNGNVKSLRTVCYGASKRTGMKFKARSVEGGVRVWRVE